MMVLQHLVKWMMQLGSLAYGNPVIADGRVIVGTNNEARYDKAVEGDIAGVTRNLGVAFNSTFIALLISIVLMFLLHQLQLQQERLVLESETYLDEHLIRHLQVPV